MPLALYALTVGAFGIGVTEFIIMGLLMGFRGYYNQFERHNPRLYEKFARFNVCTPKQQPGTTNRMPL